MSPTLFPSLPKFIELSLGVGIGDEHVAPLGHAASGDGRGVLVLLNASRDAIGETAPDDWPGHAGARNLAVAHSPVDLELLRQRITGQHRLSVSPDPFGGSRLSAAGERQQSDNPQSPHAVLPEQDRSIADIYAEREG